MRPRRSNIIPRNDVRDDAHREERIRSCQCRGCSNGSGESFQCCMACRCHAVCVVRRAHQRRRGCSTGKDGQQMEWVLRTNGCIGNTHHRSSMKRSLERCEPTLGRRKKNITNMNGKGHACTKRGKGGKGTHVNKEHTTMQGHRFVLIFRHAVSCKPTVIASWTNDRP